MANGEGYYTQQPDMDTVQDIIRKKNLLQGLLPGLQLGTPVVEPGEPQPATTDDQGQPLYYPDAPVPVGAPPSPVVAAPTPAQAPEIAGLADIPDASRKQARYVPASVSQDQVGGAITPSTEQAERPQADVAPQPVAQAPEAAQPSSVDPAIQNLLNRLEDQDKAIKALGGQLPQPPGQKQRILGAIAAGLMAGPGRQPALGVEVGQQAVWGPYERQLQRYGLQKQDLQSQYERTLKTFEGVEKAKSEAALERERLAQANRFDWMVAHPNVKVNKVSYKDAEGKDQVGYFIPPDADNPQGRIIPVGGVADKPLTGQAALFEENVKALEGPLGLNRKLTEEERNQVHQRFVDSGRATTLKDLDVAKGKKTEAETTFTTGPKTQLTEAQTGLTKAKTESEPIKAAAAATSAAARAESAATGGKDVRQARGQYRPAMVKAVGAYKSSVESADTAINSLESKTQVGDVVAIPEALKALVAGQASGFRMTQAEINQVMGAQTKPEEFWSLINKWIADPSSARFPPGFRGNLTTLLKSKKKEALRKMNHSVDALKKLDSATDIGGVSDAYGSFAAGPPDETPKKGPVQLEIGPDGKLREKK